jgi:hypothetical protein
MFNRRFQLAFVHSIIKIHNLSIRMGLILQCGDLIRTKMDNMPQLVSITWQTMLCYIFLPSRVWKIPVTAYIHNFSVVNISSNSGWDFHFSLGILGTFLRSIDSIFVSYSPGFRYIGGKREQIVDSGETILPENSGHDSDRKSLMPTHYSTLFSLHGVH